MKQIFGRIMIALVLLVVLPWVMFTGVAVVQSENSEESKAIFFVGWYDIGKTALEGMKGVISVDKGFQDGKETNTVLYDPTLITIKELESALKDAGTHRGRVR